jgi:hypothetical protein
MRARTHGYGKGKERRILASSDSPGTRQRPASDLVCAAEAMLVESLTLILSL